MQTIVVSNVKSNIGFIAILLLFEVSNDVKISMHWSQNDCFVDGAAIEIHTIKYFVALSCRTGHSLRNPTKMDQFQLSVWSVGASKFQTMFQTILFLFMGIFAYRGPYSILH